MAKAIRIDMVGERFGRLTVLRYDGNDKRGEAKWLCICDCGSETTVLGSHLRAGRVVSCGCYAKEKAAELRKTVKTKGNYKHGGAHSRLYTTWSNMKTRCLNPGTKAFKWYGAVGVTICQEWMQFEGFEKWAMESGYKDNLTIERIDPFGNYCPENCTWIPKKDQRKNQRRSKRCQSLN